MVLTADIIEMLLRNEDLENRENFYILLEHDSDLVQFRYITPNAGILAKYGDTTREIIKKMEFDLHVVFWEKGGRSQFTFCPPEELKETPLNNQKLIMN